ncbi:MAG TPA: serine/threonine dehydratase [Dehalococcoidia bacterium]|nr:serine/threonine dehydratase [Dehalococcoidia bacterium]
MSSSEILRETLRAQRRIQNRLSPTPLEHSSYFSESSGANVYLKLENFQPTGSFKVRGALNSLLSMSEEQRAKGVVAASSGNHGLAVAYGASALGIGCEVFVPEHAPQTKTDAIRRLGGRLRHHGADVAVTESFTRSHALENDKSYISPYNDIKVIGGQGTIALELGQQLDRIDAIYVAVGGGGLISGIAGYSKSVFDNPRIVGCLPENSPVMAESVRAGQIIDMESKPTLSDGTAGGIEPGSITFEICQQLVDEFVVVSEGEIADAMRLFTEVHHMLIEGAAALPLASFLKEQKSMSGENIVLVICGANVSLQTLKGIL